MNTSSRMNNIQIDLIQINTKTYIEFFLDISELTQ
ncbi:Uncharacterised protein [Yersinia pseudotuberculosis]|nr:Uncharacterised protein [Yersinia pseudotuberculosis]